ncbi:Eukaryotic peptide chain release factor subunit 1 [Penicillium subrubescens]|uniref:Eukaryotic peptide chain release factor subunit 1 n=1 Tax=Penicillium subrubescens TaxID=1316194 RepID=A0A1Q5SP02_9EURO|nr:Eukaryotic peptide chain release factor subunit 1 [Penicillium subrubescens]
MSSQQQGQGGEAEKNIEIWKVKKLIKRLESARGNGTSMISLIIPPKDQISRAAKMLAEEYGTASNIKSRVNRLSVLSAITSTQQRLKLYNKVPPNGLVVYCGEIITAEGKERKINIDFEPFKPINTSLYLCDNKFHTEALSELLESDQKFGFIIMDGNGALFGTLSGNTREILQRLSVDLPKKHGRGGQSALRFARLREEKRHNYVRKIAELAVQNYITNDKVNVAGLVLAGSADFKNDLNQSDMFDQRLQSKVIKVVDVSYGGENGFNQAIELAAETLSSVKFIQEKKLIGKYFEEISQDTGKICYGVEDTLKALELGAAETLIVFENLDVTRWVLKDSAGGEVVLHTTKTQETNRELFQDKETGGEMEVIDSSSFLEWLAEAYKDFGAELEFVSDRSSEGNQFVKGFGGIGAILRYKVNFEQLADYSDDDDEDERPEAPEASLLTARPVDQASDSETGTQASVKDTINPTIPGFVKLLRGVLFIPLLSFNDSISNPFSRSTGSSKLRDMLTEVTSVSETNMWCKLQFERLDAILCNIYSPIAACLYRV